MYTPDLFFITEVKIIIIRKAHKGFFFNQDISMETENQQENNVL